LSRVYRRFRQGKMLLELLQAQKLHSWNFSPSTCESDSHHFLCNLIPGWKASNRDILALRKLCRWLGQAHDRIPNCDIRFASGQSFIFRRFYELSNDSWIFIRHEFLIVANLPSKDYPINATHGISAMYQWLRLRKNLQNSKWKTNKKTIFDIVKIF